VSDRNIHIQVTSIVGPVIGTYVGPRARRPQLHPGMSAGTGGASTFPWFAGSHTTLALALPVTSKKTIDPARLERPVAQLKGSARSRRRAYTSSAWRAYVIFSCTCPSARTPSRITSVVRSRSARGHIAGACHVVRSPGDQTPAVTVLEALVGDDTGSVLATWYNQPYLQAPFSERPESS